MRKKTQNNPSLPWTFLSMMFVLFFCFPAYAQPPTNDNCGGATLICAGTPVSGTTVGATPDGVNPSCFGVENGVWFTFTTLPSVGNAIVSFTNLVSINGNTGLQVAVFSGNNGCASLAELVCDTLFNADFSLPVNNLPPGTVCYVLVDGAQQAGLPGLSNFSVSISGSAVEPFMSLQITQPPCNSPTGSILVDSLVFGGTNVVFSLNGGTPQAVGIFLNLTPGFYSVQVSNDEGCELVLTATINPATIIQSTLTTNAANCNVSDGSISITGVSGGSGTYQFSLNDTLNQGSGTFTGLGAGFYTVVISDGNCDTTLTAIVASQQGIQFASAQITDANCGANNGVVSYAAANSVVSVPPQTNYTFSLCNPLGTVITSNTTGVFNGLPAGFYYVRIFDPNNCEFVDRVTVNSLPGPTVTASVQAPDDCGNKTGSVVFTPADGVPPYMYSVAGAVFTSSNTAIGLGAGNYTVVVKDVNGCTSQSSFSVAEGNGGVSRRCDAGLDQQIYLGEKARIQPVFLPGSTFSISPSTSFISPNDTTFVVSPPINTTYTLTVVEPNGCVCTSRVTINVLNTIKVANAITPNQDGINDIWIIQNVENYDNVEVYLYTRWGQRIFYSSGYPPGAEFNGTFLGSSLPVATYYYVVKFNFRGEKRNYYYTGSLALLR